MASDLLHQYRAWIEPDSGYSETDRQAFYTDALIVLDTNVLLDLYRYTPEARNQVVAALRLVSERLWLPHQVGLEFVRNRRGVVSNRVETMRQAKAQVDRALNEAWVPIGKSLEQVQGLLGRFAADEAGQTELAELISKENFRELIGTWRSALFDRIDSLKQTSDIGLRDVDEGTDTVLAEVTALFGTRVGSPPDPDELRRRIDWAISYRYPNMIPPGFRDNGKSTDFGRAGDFLLWEELITHVQGMASPVRVLLVSGDLKEDWYEPLGPGIDRPLPALLDEFRDRTGSEILIVESKAFFEGVTSFLNADITTSTVEEIGRTAETRNALDEEVAKVVTAEDAATLSPPADLPLLAYRAARLSSSVIRSAVTDTDHRMFQWWLIGVTEELGYRDREVGEPAVDMVAVVRGELPPAPDWLDGTVITQGEWPFRSSSWIAPWMAQMIKATPAADRAVLLRLALKQLTQRADAPDS